MAKIKIVFNPKADKHNSYPRMIVTALMKHNFYAYSLKEFVKNIYLWREIQLVHLNWFENLQGKTTTQIAFDLYTRLFFIYVLKAFNKKIIWTMHNKAPHVQVGSKHKLRLMKYLLKMSNKVVIHSHSTRSVINEIEPTALDKICHIPHPNYVGVYGPIIKDDLHDQKLELLFFGSVQPYKNIELLINTVSQLGDSVRLTIAGHPKTADYKDTIETLAQDVSNVNLILQFIDDKYLPTLLSKCDLVILPYDLRSSLNSGSVILAFSYQKSVICPEIGSILDLKSQNAAFTYTYLDEIEHQNNLKKQILKASMIKRDYPGALSGMGKTLYNEILVENSLDTVSEKLVQVYSDTI